jgi:hypothetical protein
LLSAPEEDIARAITESVATALTSGGWSGGRIGKISRGCPAIASVSAILAMA